jgi:hypothetical protein
MSRAMNLTPSESEVKRICEDARIAITSIEKLLPSGTRVVCLNGDGAATLRNKMRGKIIEGTVKRMPRSLRTAF